MRGVLAAVFLLAATACAPIFSNHGYVPPPEALNELQLGVTTKAEVGQAIGRPSASGILSESGWYYVQSRFRQYGYRREAEIDRQVVSIQFDPAGRVSNVSRFGLERGRVVPLSRRITDTGVQEIGFLRQLFGNVGNFALGDFVN
ncbi:outer membrane protein assembly factor BamE [Palleronia sediminis]|nr:outer membrane protein assembly factor BamE [Palleronia sediminis]